MPTRARCRARVGRARPREDAHGALHEARVQLLGLVLDERAHGVGHERLVKGRERIEARLDDRDGASLESLVDAEGLLVCPSRAEREGAV